MVGGENSSGPAFPVIIDELKSQLIEQDVGENQYHDIAVKRDAFNEELFFESIHENRLFVPGWQGEKVPVTFTMFRKDVVDHILENHVIKDYVGEGKGTCGWGNRYIRYTFADIVANVRPFVDRLAQEIRDEEGQIRFYLMDSLHRYRDEFVAVQWIITDYRFSRIVDLRVLIADLLLAEKLDEVEALLIEHVRGSFMERFMDSARKTWIPGGHEGSQNSSDVALMELYEATKVAIKNDKLRWGEGELDDEDDQ